MASTSAVFMGVTRSGSRTARRPHRRRVAAAVLAASAASPALAQPDSSVQIYGFIKEDVETVRLSGNGRSESLTRLVNDLSVLGFRGQERISGDLEAFFQIETNLRMTGTGTSEISDRNSGLGLRGPWGEFLMGQWEMPLRFASVYTVDPFTAGVFASNSIMGNGFTTAGNGVAPHSFDRRQKNLFQYATPNWRGFSLKMGVTLPERMPTGNPMAWSALASYASGDWFVAWGHEYHRDYFYDGSADHADRLAVTYTFGGTKLRGAYERLRYQPAPGQSVYRDAWQLAATQSFGPHQLRASYTYGADAHGDTTKAVGGIGVPGSGSGAWQISLGYGYTLSKRTEVWTSFTRLVNGETARYNLSGNPLPQLTAGDAATAFGVGITHKF
ncbi:Outer membrane porin protein 32 [Achromobacter deleyi]|uniref:Outer membrane porin protein 32 n=1 Tax=Achromobacter deleyi TaxID=1353891 RepID=A0A6S6ZYN8_9BURK|nr:porin [Achromobacter deleyi]CAB3703613.1 Outer membrane porin protein 32 [Achromobacter deleyi]CAB3857282.1 Outer membrane porin protein 32 [Achromobacter deleyi]CAB3882242.1 Outer membrane porin protein 32 [Achromobacter deleyi]CAB3884957.1 Outer membrane porin protein 32 [Achromobacter deleyi]